MEKPSVANLLKEKKKREITYSSEKIAADVELFMARGGRVQKIPLGVSGLATEGRKVMQIVINHRKL